MSPTAAPADTRTASEPAVVSDGHGRPHSEQAVLSEAPPAAPAPGPRDTRSRLAVLLLLLVAVAAAAGLFAASGMPRLPDGVSTAPDVLVRPTSALPVAAVVLGLALLLRITVPRLARSGRSAVRARRDRHSDREAGTGPVELGVELEDQDTASGSTVDAGRYPVVTEPATATPSAGATTVEGTSALSISPHALELQVRCLEATLAEQDEVLAHQERALGEQRTALDEAHRQADQQAVAARETERRRVRAAVHALRDTVADVPGDVAADRVATALERLSVDAGFARPLLAPPSGAGLAVVFAAPAPAPEAGSTPPPRAAPAPSTAVHAAPAQSPAVHAAPAPAVHADPGPVSREEPVPTGDAEPLSAAASKATGAEAAAPVRVLPVPVPAPAPAPVRARRGLFRGRSS